MQASADTPGSTAKDGKEEAPPATSADRGNAADAYDDMRVPTWADYAEARRRAIARALGRPLTRP